MSHGIRTVYKKGTKKTILEKWKKYEDLLSNLGSGVSHKLQESDRGLALLLRTNSF